MKCSYHPDLEAVSACSNCGRLVCQDCQSINNEKSYCKACAENLALTPQDKRTTLNWFQKHLNWTWVLAIALTFIIGVILGIILVFTGAYYSMSEAEIDGWDRLINILIMVPVSLWVLHRKNRSWGWIFLSGIFAPLWLSNKREEYVFTSHYGSALTNQDSWKSQSETYCPYCNKSVSAHQSNNIVDYYWCSNCNKALKPNDVFVAEG